MAQPISNLPLGSRVKDPTWTWEHRTGNGYTGSGEIKPVSWIIVAKNHPGYPTNSVTMISEEVIGKFVIDNNPDGEYGRGIQHWGESGKPPATRGIRKFLNGSSYSGLDTNNYNPNFYDSLGDYFKSILLLTTVPNKTYDNIAYETQDKIFLPSTVNLNAHDPSFMLSVDSVFAYFVNATNAMRAAKLGGTNTDYWTRTPALLDSVYSSTRGVYVKSNGGVMEPWFVTYVSNDFHGIRPVVNVINTAIVSSEPDADGVYFLGGDPFPTMQVAINGTMRNIVDGYVGINGANRRISGAIVGINGVNKEV